MAKFVERWIDMAHFNASHYSVEVICEECHVQVNGLRLVDGRFVCYLCSPLLRRGW